MIWQLLGIILIGVAWALFTWRYEISYRAVCWLAARRAKRRRASRIWRAMYGGPWDGGGA